MIWGEINNNKDSLCCIMEKKPANYGISFKSNRIASDFISCILLVHTYILLTHSIE